jgi:hypothetical protein
MILGGLVLVFTTGAQANSVTWTINNAIFDDGGTLTGGFTFDEGTNLFTDVSITTSDNSFLVEHDYSSLSLFSPLIAISNHANTSPQYFNGSFQMVFSELLTDAGGVVALTNATREGCTAGSPFGGSRCDAFAQTGWSRMLVSGTVSVSAVPVPAAVWLFGTALMGIVGFGKRRKAA